MNKMEKLLNDRELNLWLTVSRKYETLLTDAIFAGDTLGDDIADNLIEEENIGNFLRYIYQLEDPTYKDYEAINKRISNEINDINNKFDSNNSPYETFTKKENKYYVPVKEKQCSLYYYIINGITFKNLTIVKEQYYDINTASIYSKFHKAKTNLIFYKGLTIERFLINRN